MKGIILAGGKGTRLYPLTLACSKQLLPVYDKPMIYYPLTTLMMGGIKDILIITTPEDSETFFKLLGNGNQWGISLTYAIQKNPRGLADAFIIGEEFIENDSVCLILGDNIFFGHNLEKIVRNSMKNIGATIFAYPISDPERYGVVEFDEDNKAISLEEKPINPKSNYAVPGIYFYNVGNYPISREMNVVSIAKNLVPSDRGEIEITDINRFYMDRELLNVEVLGRGFAWLDAGTHESLNSASNFVKTIKERQGLMIACPEEIAYQKKFINKGQLKDQIARLGNNDYTKYLNSLLTK